MSNPSSWNLVKTRDNSGIAGNELAGGGFKANGVNDIYTGNASRPPALPRHQHHKYLPYPLQAVHEQLLMELPWNSYSELHRHPNLDIGRRYQFADITSKMNRMPDFFDRCWPNMDDYPDYAALVIMAIGMDANRFSSCQSGHRYSCCNRKLCPYCAYAAKLRAWCRYLNAYAKGTYVLLTFTIHGSVPGEAFGMESIVETWDAVWRLLHGKHRPSSIEGAVVVEEVHVDSLHPRLMVYPHVHAVAKLSRVYDSRAEGASLMECIRTEFAEDGITMSLDLRLLDNPRGFMDALGYLFKPVQILGPYAAAINGLEPSRIWEVNQNVRALFELLDAIPQEDRDCSGGAVARRSVYYLGCMHPSSSIYVGDRSYRLNRQQVEAFMGIGVGGHHGDVAEVPE